MDRVIIKGLNIRERMSRSTGVTITGLKSRGLKFVDKLLTQAADR